MGQEVSYVGSNLGDSEDAVRLKKDFIIKVIVISFFVIALTLAAISVFFIARTLSSPDCYSGEYYEEGDACIFDIDAMMASENVYALSEGEFVECPDGSVFDEDSGLCEVPDSSFVCEEGDYNSESEKCEYSPSVYVSCSEGDYNSEEDVCEIVPETIYECEGELQEVDGVMSCVVGFDVLEAACGDGACDQFERFTGVCSEDCVGTLFCGDGDCEDREKLFCELDCGKIVHPCGDGVCGEKELADSGLCPGDCEVAVSVDSGYDDSPFGILTALYPLEREGEMGIPSEYLWEFSENDNPTFSTVQDLGLGWDRGTHPILDWSYVQKTPIMIQNNEFDWSVSDNYIKKIPDGINFVVTLNAGAMAIPRGSWQFVNVNFENAYSNFVKKAVERYDGDGIDDMPGLVSPVKYWQIENEPVAYVDFNVVPVEPNYDYGGYAKLLEISYMAIRESDLNAKVLSAGIVSQAEPRNSEILNNFWFPLIEQLQGNYIDIFDFHWFEEWNGIGGQYNTIRSKLDSNGFNNIPIWITENGVSSEVSEVEQAEDLVKRMINPLALGVEKVFWAWGLVEGWPPFDCVSKFEYTGLIYDGNCLGDPGYGIKKLAYYSYKQITTKLDGSNWDNIQVVQESGDVYVYKFTNKETGKFTWAAWSDSGSGSVSLDLLGIDNAKVVEAVPDYDNGLEVEGVAFEDMFRETFVSGSVELGEVPVFIEESD